MTELSAMDFRRGGHVPGKRQRTPKDTVAAVLAPHEAVLTPGAADKVGRGKIDRLNAESRMGKRKHFSTGASDTSDQTPYARQQEPYSETSNSARGGVGYSRGTSRVGEGKREPMSSPGQGQDKSWNAPGSKPGYAKGTSDAGHARRLSMGCSGVDNGSGMERAMGAHAEKMHPVGRR